MDLQQELRKAVEKVFNHENVFLIHFGIDCRRFELMSFYMSGSLCIAKLVDVDNMHSDDEKVMPTVDVIAFLDGLDEEFKYD